MAGSSKRPVIVVLGGINMDLIGVTKRLAAPGETVRGDDFYTAPGGKGANQAAAAARLGAESAWSDGSGRTCSVRCCSRVSSRTAST